jgi:hypothetical protein
MFGYIQSYYVPSINVSRLRYRKHAKLNDRERCLKAKPTPDSSTMMKIVARANMASLDHEDVEDETVSTDVSEASRSVNGAIGS